MDGDNFSLNNIKTAGAGAIGRKLSINDSYLLNALKKLTGIDYSKVVGDDDNNSNSKNTNTEKNEKAKDENSNKSVNFSSVLRIAWEWLRQKAIETKKTLIDVKLDHFSEAMSIAWSKFKQQNA
jgi:hypothetical protein